MDGRSIGSNPPNRFLSLQGFLAVYGFTSLYKRRLKLKEFETITKIKQLKT